MDGEGRREGKREMRGDNTTSNVIHNLDRQPKANELAV